MGKHGVQGRAAGLVGARVTEKVRCELKWEGPVGSGQVDEGVRRREAEQRGWASISQRLETCPLLACSPTSSQPSASESPKECLLEREVRQRSTVHGLKRHKEKPHLSAGTYVNRTSCPRPPEAAPVPTPWAMVLNWLEIMTFMPVQG